jgi:hypothetical protein
MNKRSKKILCYSFDPLALRPSIHIVPWSDVWVKFYQRRKKITFAPTLINGHDLEGQIKMCQEQNAHMRKVMQNKIDTGERCEMYDTKENIIDWLSHDPDPSVYEDNSEYSDVPILTERKKYFDTYPKEDFKLEESEYPSPTGFYYFDIITRYELNQKTAEKAIEWYLKKKNIINNVSLRFHWPLPKVIVIPVGF